MAPPFELKCRNFALDLEFIRFSSRIYFVEFSGDYCRLPGQGFHAVWSGNHEWNLL